MKLGAVLVLCHILEARRIQPLPSSTLDKYLCRAGRGQAGQNYASFSGSKDECQTKCDADASCMAYEFAAEAPQPCSLFGANVPDLGKEGSEYCLRTSFSPAEKVPGDGKFEPDMAWIAEQLQVPVRNGTCKRLAGGGLNGASGAQFFSCSVDYEGTTAFPNLGLATELFIKLRTPVVAPHEFDVERQTYALAGHLPTTLPVPRLLSGARNQLILESSGKGVERGHVFSEQEVEAILESYAKLHSSFWGLTGSLKLKSVREWSQIFGGVVGFSPEQVAGLMTAAKLPASTIQLAMRLGNMGYLKALQYMLSRGQTLVQGDAHIGQVLHSDDGSVGGKWMLADFGWAHASQPAVDIGAILPKLSRHPEKHLKHYWQKFSKPLGEKLQLDYEEFVVLWKLGAFFRGTFKLGMLFFDAPGQPRAEPTDFSDGVATADLLEWFQVVDAEMVEYLEKKTENMASSLLSLEELPPPNQAVFRALRDRELSY